MEKPAIGKKVRMVVAVLVLSLVAPGCGTIGIQPQIKAEVMMTSGDKVHLFYGGPQDAKDMFCIGETVSVYRAYPQKRLRYIEVGKVRIERPIDKKYLEGIVVEGKVKEGDLARKSIAACKVLPPLPGRE
jgi:hypothetical protein